LFISIRIAASCGQPLQDSWVPRGARTGRGPDGGVAGGLGGGEVVNAGSSSGLLDARRAAAVFASSSPVGPRVRQRGSKLAVLTGQASA